MIKVMKDKWLGSAKPLYALHPKMKIKAAMEEDKENLSFAVNTFLARQKEHVLFTAKKSVDSEAIGIEDIEIKVEPQEEIIVMEEIVKEEEEMCGQVDGSILQFNITIKQDEGNEVKVEEAKNDDVFALDDGEFLESVINQQMSKLNGIEALSGEQFKCDKCEKVFSSNKNLRCHYVVHMASRPYKCMTCKKSFAQKKHLKSHEITHVHKVSDAGRKEYKCVVCEKSFNNKFTLRAHVRSHPKERTHVCDYCNKRFSQRCSLVMHLKVHAEKLKKPLEKEAEKDAASVDKLSYKCGFCEQVFRRKVKLNHHEKQHSAVDTKVTQQPNEDQTYPCNLCKAVYRQKSFLAIHKKRTHSANQIPTTVSRDAIHVCSTCNKCFGHISHLRRHEMIHTGDKPFECDRCGSCFNRKDILKTHYRVHTGERPHVCQFCHLRFRYRKTAVRHRESCARNKSNSKNTSN